MAELIHRRSTRIWTPEDQEFVAYTYAERTPSGMWFGWLEFVSADGRGPVLRTDRETTQPNRAAIDYWASGLGPVYLEGAFERARRVTRSVGDQQARRTFDLGRARQVILLERWRVRHRRI